VEGGPAPACAPALHPCVLHQEGPHLTAPGRGLVPAPPPRDLASAKAQIPPALRFGGGGVRPPAAGDVPVRLAPPGRGL